VGLKIFRKCDSKYDWVAYIRFGLYYMFRNGERSNFCDIHLGWIPGDPIDEGVYSGPKDAVSQITRYDRSGEAVRRYKDDQRVRPDLALTAGGRAKFVRSNKRTTMDIWLFGPLLSEGVAYGSLVAELEGLELPKTGHQFTPIDEKTGKERNETDPKSQRYLVFYPKNYGLRYLPCTLWGSTYAEGPRPSAPGNDNVIYDGGSTIHYKDDHAPGEKDYVKPGPAPPLIDALRDARASLKLAFLPKNVTKVVWKIEDFSAGLTSCQVLDRGG
jgi:hypothetical protein